MWNDGQRLSPPLESLFARRPVQTRDRFGVRLLRGWWATRSKTCGSTAKVAFRHRLGEPAEPCRAQRLLRYLATSPTRSLQGRRP